jgi:uncharacterized membrane protein YccC
MSTTRHEDGEPSALHWAKSAQVAIATAHRRMAVKAEALVERLGLSYESLLGLRFAINVFLAGAIVWFTLLPFGDKNPMWAIASMVAAADPAPEQAVRLFRSRLTNVVVGCVVGFSLLLVGGRSHWMVPFSLAVAVLISSYFVRVHTMWRQAPISAALVIAAGVVGSSTTAGVGRGLQKVAEVLFGCLVGVLVSRLMSKVWLVRPKKVATADASQIPIPNPSTDD